MVSEPFREKLEAASAPFDDKQLRSMPDWQACKWLERNSDDPWLFHGLRNRDGQPRFMVPRKQSAESDALTWFHDTEKTYIALRVLLATDSAAFLFAGLCFHLAQQVVEKGVKSLLALQCNTRSQDFDPRRYGHSLVKAIGHLTPEFVPAEKATRMCEVAEAFELGHYVGKYEVDTGGGVCVGLDGMRPVDCYMKMVRSHFIPKCERRVSSLIDRVADGSVFSGGLPAHPGIGAVQIRRALFWRNPVLFPDWERRSEALSCRDQ